MNNKKALSIILLLLATTAWSEETKEFPEFEEIECTIIEIDRTKLHPKKTFPNIQYSTPFRSTNWSGYAAAPTFKQPTPGAVTYVAGSWVVPSIIASEKETHCAIWVGMGGFLESSIQQIGTSHSWEDGQQNNYAWFEMYPHGAYEIGKFPLDRGDMISARVGYKGDDRFKLTIMNHTKRVSTTIPKVFTYCEGAERTSAEWIIEAPTSGSILPLADFGISTFNYCSATINGYQGSISDICWNNDVITMGSASEVKALPSDLLKNGNCFQVTWQHE